MNESDDFGLRDVGRRIQNFNEPHPRATGSPLPIGKAARPPFAQQEEELFAASPTPLQTPLQTPLPGRALPGPATPMPEPATGLQRALGALRMAVPFMQKVLPLLDGNIATALANVLTPHTVPPPPAPAVDLVPIENGLAELRSHHRDLRNQILEQNTSLKRVEDQLEMVREATDRNTLEQQELLEDLKAVGSKMTLFATLALLLLLGSVALNVILYLHIQRILP